MLFAQRVLSSTMESRIDHPHLEARKTSYMPINLLPIVPKVFEKLLLKKLLPMVENNGLIPSHQFSFRQRHSTIGHNESYKG
jgi:hypothetical protein